MPRQLVINVETKSLPYFPILEAYKHNRIITKHFTNLSMHLDHESYVLLAWLVYESAADNTFHYSGKLLLRYKAAVLAANKEYNNAIQFKMINGISTTQFNLRAIVCRLIENGYLIQMNSRKLIINPRLVYYEYLSYKEIALFNGRYQSAHKNNVIELMNDYIQMVKNKM